MTHAPTNIVRHCVRCGARYEVHAEELIDGVYSPLCDQCLADSTMKNLPVDPRENERPISELRLN